MFTMQKLSIVAWLMASLLLASILFIILRGIDIAISRGRPRHGELPDEPFNDLCTHSGCGCAEFSYVPAGAIPTQLSRQTPQ
ncbi:hypothetical protein AK812_SmicGene8055 [Symbiodinium microadriaticum]|uniref:Uncharacterized protein n=1 Tax=Symbiodinium microadriaticum TaxID=2951 RepID=A0A1Q9ELY5_SYMMI|nr:hypothetical protein AK812_SmicGene8055 [Symbiodinium microadriaticum]